VSRDGAVVVRRQVITWFQNRRAKLKRDVEELKADMKAAKALGTEPAPNAAVLLSSLDELLLKGARSAGKKTRKDHSSPSSSTSLSPGGGSTVMCGAVSATCTAAVDCSTVCSSSSTGAVSEGLCCITGSSSSVSTTTGANTGVPQPGVTTAGTHTPQRTSDDSALTVTLRQSDSLSPDTQDRLGAAGRDVVGHTHDV